MPDLAEEIREYDRLKESGPRTLELDSLDSLPRVLIQARIAAGLTQKNWLRLGVKAQQIQCYEASGYQNASFARVREIAHVLGIAI